MDGPNFYNEIDPYAAQWLRNLIAAGHIAPGVVDERSIEDIKPKELYGYTQCHFFAGVGVWSLALRHAGWPDDRPIWTGSCPCQPFSAAGQGAGFADERHLWPAFHHLIAECRPPIVLGEQVASSNVDPWIDLVHADLEAVDYSFGGVPFPSAGIGAPHIRDRLYWVANADDGGRQRGRAGKARDGRDAARIEPERLRDADRLADAMRARPLPGALTGVHRGEEGAGARDGKPQRPGAIVGLADSSGERFDGQRLCVQPRRSLEGHAEIGRHREAGGLADAGCGGLEAVQQHSQVAREGAREGSSGNSPAHASGDRGGFSRLGHTGHNHDAGEIEAAGTGKSQADGPTDFTSRPGVSLGGLADTGSERRQQDAGSAPSDEAANGAARWDWGEPDGNHIATGDVEVSGTGAPGPTNGYWANADWLGCRDGKWRPVEPGTSPLAHGAPARVGRLRAYGNAINAEAARIFIEVVMESL